MLAGLLLGACGGNDDAIELPRSPEQLEAAARRGDSMAAMISVGQAIADSLAKIASGELDRSLLATLARPVAEGLPAQAATGAEASGTGSGRTMSERAQARGDSMARETARALERTLAPAANRATSDTLRGIVTLDGAPPAVRVTLVSPLANMPVALSGMAISELLRLDGLEVVARGVRVSPRDLAVASFSVRATGGVPVADGVLTNTNGAWALELSEGGLRPLARVPAGLQPYAGERVWIATEAGASPSFGVITRRR